MGLELLEDRTLLSGFADTTTGIHIFMDQLGNLSPQMTQFIATHVDGTQKQTPGQIANLRSVNPNFALIDYRLGTMAGPPQYIINGQWASDWTTVNSHEDWFLHQSYSGEPQSAADLASGRIRDTNDNSYAMDISNPSWENYWLTTELQDMQAVGANGVFADSFTYGIGGAGYDAPPTRNQGTNAANGSFWPGGVSWTTQLGTWAQTIENNFHQYNAAHGTNYVFLPNLDARATSWEPNWYYNNGVPFIDGAFLEGFGGYTDTYNWSLSMNRGLDLTRNGKIVIMQPYTSSTNQQQIDFLIGTYLLLKSNQTYLAINGTDYYPEYQVNLGAPTTAIPTAAQGVNGYLWNGVYRRDFQNGFVLVNPGSTTYSLNLGGTYQLVQGHGGGALGDTQLDANGNYIGGSLTYQNMSSITLAGGTAAIFLNSTSSNAAPTVATAAKASPSPVTGTSTVLSVLGADDKGEGNLTYTWSSSGPAGVTFSANGSNAAKNTTVTFTRAGNYSFTVTIADQGGLSTTSSVNVTVNQTLSRIGVSPTSATVVDGATQQFSATGFDQFNQALANQPAFTWSIASGLGTVSASGLYTAPASGAGSATVQAASGSLTGTASITVQAAVIAPSITTQPSSQTVTVGQAVTFTVAATGTAPLAFQWQKSVNGVWTNVGTNAASFTLSAAAAADAGTYRVLVSNSAGTATSNSVTLTVNSGAVIGTGTGLTGQYFADQTLTNLVLTRTDATVNFNWGTGSPASSVPVDHFSARWTGQVQAQYSETYTFYTESDDGVRLWVNGQQLINNWSDHAPTENSGTLTLVAGQKYDIKMEYYENGGGAVAQLLWSSPSTAKQAIPTSQLYAASLVAPSITTQPGSLTVTAGQSASFTVAANGTAPLTYQWLKQQSGTWTSISGATAATYSIAATAATDAGSYRVIVTNSAGSATSNTATLTVNPVATLPAPWVDSDIGGPGQKGSGSAASGTFTVKGGGADIWGTSDQFNYTYQTLTGDGTIVARVASQQNTDGWAKAGVMIRASTAANAVYAFAFVSPGNGADFQYRTAAGGQAGWTGQLSAAAPEWVKLVRAGTTFTGYASSDGVTWTTLGSISISMAATVDIGLAVTAHNNAALSTATFTNVSVTQTPAGSAIVVHISEDYYQGDAQYTIAVDGLQVGGTRTATAIHNQGQSESVVLAGPYAAGTHTVSVSFLNDAWGGTSTTDRNLYIDSIDFNGKTITGGLLYSNGTLTFTVGP